MIKIFEIICAYNRLFFSKYTSLVNIQQVMRLSCFMNWATMFLITKCIKIGRNHLDKGHHEVRARLGHFSNNFIIEHFIMFVSVCYGTAILMVH